MTSHSPLPNQHKKDIEPIKRSQHLHIEGIQNSRWRCIVEVLSCLTSSTFDSGSVRTKCPLPRIAESLGAAVHACHTFCLAECYANHRSSILGYGPHLQPSLGNHGENWASSDEVNGADVWWRLPFWDFWRNGGAVVWKPSSCSW